MQIILPLFHRPHLESGRVSSNSSEVRIMQKILRVLSARHARKADIAVRARRSRVPLYRTELAVPRHEPRPHEQYVAYADRPAFAGGPEVEALPACAGA